MADQNSNFLDEQNDEQNSVLAPLCPSSYNLSQI